MGTSARTCFCISAALEKWPDTLWRGSGLTRGPPTTPPSKRRQEEEEWQQRLLLHAATDNNGNQQRPSRACGRRHGCAISKCPFLYTRARRALRSDDWWGDVPWRCVALPSLTVLRCIGGNGRSDKDGSGDLRGVGSVKLDSKECVWPQAQPNTYVVLYKECSVSSDLSGDLYLYALWHQQRRIPCVWCRQRGQTTPLRGSCEVMRGPVHRGARMPRQGALQYPGAGRQGPRREPWVLA